MSYAGYWSLDGEVDAAIDEMMLIVLGAVDDQDDARVIIGLLLGIGMDMTRRGYAVEEYDEVVGNYAPAAVLAVTAMSSEMREAYRPFYPGKHDTNGWVAPEILARSIVSFVEHYKSFRVNPLVSVFLWILMIGPNGGVHSKLTIDILESRGGL